MGRRLRSMAVVALLGVTAVSHAGLNDGLIAYYPFDADLSDASGHPAVSLQNSGGTIQTNGRVKSCLYLATTNRASSSALNISQLPCSISFWFKVKTIFPDGGSKILHNWGYGGNGGGERGVILDYTDGRTINFVVGGGVPTLYHALDPIETNTWQHIALVCDPTGVGVYRNGRFSTRLVQALAPSPTTTFWLGKDPEDWWGRFDGWIDEVRVYGRTLSSSEVNALFYNMPAGAVLTIR